MDAVIFVLSKVGQERRDVPGRGQSEDRLDPLLRISPVVRNPDRRTIRGLPPLPVPWRNSAGVTIGPDRETRPT